MQRLALLLLLMASPAFGTTARQLAAGPDRPLTKAGLKGEGTGSGLLQQPAKPTPSPVRTFRARLSTVPIDVAMQSTITGSGTVTATLVGATLALNGTFANLKSPATIAKIHVAPKGIRGPAVLDLIVAKAANGTLTGTFELSPQQIDDLTHSRFYIQLHSEKAPDGNLWGWLLPREPRQ